MTVGRIPNVEGGIQPTLLTTTGDIMYASSASNPARLGIGSSAQVLTVSGGVPSWATPSSGGMTLISTTTLSGASVTLSSIPATYVHLQLIIRDFLPNTDYAVAKLRFNGDSASRYTTGSGTFFNSVTDTLLGFSSSELYASSSNDNTVADGLSIINVFDYTNTVSRKLMEVLSIGTDAATTTSSRYTGLLGAYNQTGAISSITILNDAGTFTSGTVLLYGVK